MNSRTEPDRGPRAARRPRWRRRLPILSLALAAGLAAATPSVAAPDPVLVPPLPMLVPVDPQDPQRELDPLRDAASLPPAAPRPAQATATGTSAEADAPPVRPAGTTATAPVLVPADPGTGAPPAPPREAAAPPPGTGESLRAIPEDYRPAMVEALAETAGPAAAAEIGTALGSMDLESLRIIARMTPEQIDALTLLILSQSPGGDATRAAATPPAPRQDGSGPAQDGRWVGDWSGEAAGPAPDPGPWSVRETRDRRVLILHEDDVFSQLEIEAGLVLGQFGKVTRIVRGPDEVAVETASGTVLRGPRELPPPVAATAVPRTAAEPAAPAAVAAVVAVAPPAPPPAAAADTPEATAGTVVIQAASFRVAANARAAVAALSRLGLGEVTEDPLAGGRWHRVLVGPLPRSGTADALRALAGAGYPDAFVLTEPAR